MGLGRWSRYPAFSISSGTLGIKLSGNLIFYIKQQSLLTDKQKHYFLNSWYYIIKYYRIVDRPTDEHTDLGPTLIVLQLNLCENFYYRNSGYLAGYWISGKSNQLDIQYTAKFLLGPTLTSFTMMQFWLRMEPFTSQYWADALHITSQSQV